jgi:hypothetical protein
VALGTGTAAKRNSAAGVGRTIESQYHFPLEGLLDSLILVKQFFFVIEVFIVIVIEEVFIFIIAEVKVFIIIDEIFIVFLIIVFPHDRLPGRLRAGELCGSKRRLRRATLTQRLNGQTTRVSRLKSIAARSLKSIHRDISERTPRP